MKLIASVIICPLVAGLLALAPPANAQALAGPSQSSAASVERALDQSVSDKATGTVLIAKSGRILKLRSFRNPAQQEFRPSATTSYDIASMAKTFTAVLALRLQDLGRFDIDAPLGRHMPELPVPLRAITARTALSHTAGLERYLEGDDLVPRTAAQALAEIALMKHERERGEYYYSNIGPSLVALAIQRAAGQSYPSLVERLIFRPLAMKNSYFHGDARLKRANVAPTYVDGQRKGSPAEWPQTWTMLGSGGIAASAEDLRKFSRGVFAGRFLTPASRNELLGYGVSTGGRASFKTPDTLDIRYGLGLFHWRDRKGRQVHYHGGASDFGTNTGMLWRQDDDVFVAVLLNSATPAFTRQGFYASVLDALE